MEEILIILITFVKETWIPLIYKNIKPIYEISNLGRIKNINTKNILSISRSEKGYLMCSLMITSGIQRTFKIHRLIAFNFIQTPDFTDGNYWTVNHISGNKSDNSVDNLEWATFSENIRHAFRTGLNKPNKGEINGNNKYPEMLIREICQFMVDGLTNRQILKLIRVRDIKINRYLLYELRHKKIWSHNTKEYKY